MKINAAGGLFLLLVLGSINLQAQSKRSIIAAYKLAPPKAVLVELFSYQNRIDYYKRTKQDRKAENMQKDADSIMQKTLADFNNHFKFCPVYYFYDTNASMVIKRDFDGVLYDENMRLVSTPPDFDTNYFIIYYGLPALPQSNTTVTPASGNSFKSNILNYRFNPLPTFTIHDKHNRMAKRTKNYRYTSKYFNISYKDQGEYLNKKFIDFYNPE